MIYCFDIDGVLCDDLFGDYEKSVPREDIINKINQLYDDGNTIKMFTGRESKTGIDWKEFTEKQLKSWGVKYHELIFGKPVADVFIDDKAVNITDLHELINFSPVETKTKTPKIVDKSWGREICITGEKEYAAKIIEIRKGMLTSLHYPTKEKKTLYVLDGTLDVKLRDGRAITVHPGESISVTPGDLPRLKVIEDVNIFEVTTPP